MTPGTSNVARNASMSGAAARYGRVSPSTVAGAVSTSLQLSGTATAITPRSPTSGTYPSGIGSDPGGTDAASVRPRAATSIIGGASFASRTATVRPAPRP